MIRGYRSGYLPTQRREIEKGLREGTIKTVVATNALELGIDIGGLGAAILVAAGLWQLAPIKHACLRQCRSPVGFLAEHWRAGSRGAFRMGLVHGAYCVGCCWFLMTLLFFGGVMNLWWIGGLAAYVLLEKLMPMGHWLGCAVGAALVGWGAWLLAIA